MESDKEPCLHDEGRVFAFNSREKDVGYFLFNGKNKMEHNKKCKAMFFPDIYYV